MQDKFDIVRIDKIKWWITKSSQGNRIAVPLCPDHDLRLQPRIPKVRNPYGSGYVPGRLKDACVLVCAEGPHDLDIPRLYSEEQEYVTNRIDAKIFKGMKDLNLDDEATPMAKDNAKSKSGKYFVTAQIMESKRGVQVVIYAGEKGRLQKTQIFIDPVDKRTSFDNKDLHPTDVFTKFEATFEDGSKHIIEKS